LRFQSKSAEQAENAVAGLKKSWRKINLSQNRGFFDADDRLQLWKRDSQAIAAIVADYGAFQAIQMAAIGFIYGVIGAVSALIAAPLAAIRR
jgi:hypothetical protein